MKILESEKIVGINAFYSDFEGIGGKLKSNPYDFIVREISNYPPEDKKGKFTIAEVKSVNWENNILIRELSKSLHISRNRINFAGTKDKRAKTTQLLSFYKVPIENINKIDLKDIEIKNIYKSNKPVKIGNLIGNSFEITIRDIKRNIKKRDLSRIKDFFDIKKGFPNYFGIQRFGVIRPNSHIIGKYLVKGDIKSAVLSYLGSPTKFEDEKTYNLRKKFDETHDFKWALQNFTKKLNYELSILNKLAVDPDDFVSALKELPKNLLTLFIYAYQSYLFNKIISKRIQDNIPINNAIIGDIILPVRNNLLQDEFIKVNKNNIEKVNIQISKRKAYVSGLLIGAESIFSDGKMGKIEKEIISKEKIDKRDFIIPEIPFISSYGTRRPIFSYIDNLSLNLLSDEINQDKKKLIISFNLRKGSYATSFLREIMKAEKITNY